MTKKVEIKFIKKIKEYLHSIKDNAFLVAKAESEINTIVQETGTSLDAGDAVKLTHHDRLVYSKEIEWKAQPIMLYLQFAQQKTELNTQPGSTIQMMTYDNLKRGGKLEEGIRMKPQGLRSSTKDIKVYEYGNAVAVTELALKTSFTDIMEDATISLARDYALTIDIMLRDTLLAGVTNTIYGRADKKAPKISSRAEIKEDNKLTVTTIKDAVEILATSNTPKFNGAGGNYYVAFVHPHQSRDLRDDPDWVNASKYGAPEQLFTGEIGRIDDVRFIETTVQPNGVAPQGDVAYSEELQAGEDGVPVYQAVIFGENTYGMAVALPVELRDNGVTDFGREHALGWYGIFGAGILNPDRGVVIETA